MGMGSEDEGDPPDLILVQEQLQHGPLQSVNVGLALLEIKVGETLIVKSHT